MDEHAATDTEAATATLNTDEAVATTDEAATTAAAAAAPTYAAAAASSRSSRASSRSRSNSSDVMSHPQPSPSRLDVGGGADDDDDPALSAPLVTIQPPPLPPLTPARYSSTLLNRRLAVQRDRSNSINADDASSSASVVHFAAGLNTAASGDDDAMLLETATRKSSARKRTYSYGTLSPHISPALGAQAQPLPQPSSVPHSPAGAMAKHGRKLDFDDAAVTAAHPPVHPKHSGTFSPPFLLPPSAASAGPVRKASPSPIHALRALTDGGPRDPLPLSVDEVLFEEEEEDESESTVEESGEARQWQGIRGVWTQMTMLLHLAYRLMQALGMSGKWMRMTFRLTLFSIALAPAWVIIGRTYLSAKFIKRGVRYGTNARNFLDLYLPHRVTPEEEAAEQQEQGGAHASHASQSQQQSQTGTPVKPSLSSRIQASALQHALSVAGDSLHLDSLLKTIGTTSDAGRGIDLNAASEARSEKEQQKQQQKQDKKDAKNDKASQFAAAIVDNAQEPAAVPGSRTVSTEDASLPPPPAGVHISSSHFSPQPPSTARSGSSASQPNSASSHPRQLSPVVIFITGGAWSIGYKAWGALLGLGLSAHGVLVASVDYRNFPQADIEGMSLDVHTAITWVFRHIETYGGDPQRIFLAGQSAGAHLGALAVCNNVETLLSGKRTSWTAQKLRGFIGISGPYDLGHISAHLHTRGLPVWVFHKMMNNKSGRDEDLARYSPARLVQQPWMVNHMRGGKAAVAASACGSAAAAAAAVHRERLMPPFLLIHGKGDKTVHWQGTDYFAKALCNSRIPVVVRYYKNYSHTDPIIEGPLTGHDHLCHDVLAFMTTQCEAHAAHLAQQQQQAYRPRTHSFGTASAAIGTPHATPDSLGSRSSSSGASSVGSAASLFSPPLTASRPSVSVFSPPPLTAAKPNGTQLLQPSPISSPQQHREGLSQRHVAPQPQEGIDGTHGGSIHQASNGVPNDDLHAQRPRSDSTDAEHSSRSKLLSPPVPPASPGFTALLRSLTLPSWMLPGFMRSPSNPRVCSAPRIRRQLSHLTGAFAMIDDVNETESCSSLTDEEEAGSDDEDPAEVGTHLPPPPQSPPPAAPADAEYLRALQSSRGPVVAKQGRIDKLAGVFWQLLVSVWMALGWFVPSAVSRRATRVVEPLVRALRASPPPIDSPRRSPSSIPAEEGEINEQMQTQTNGETTTKQMAAADSSSSIGGAAVAPSPLDSSSSETQKTAAPHVANGSSFSTLPPTFLSASSAADRLSTQPRHRYSYPLQAASQLPKTPPRPLIPRVLIKWARWINPF